MTINLTPEQTEMLKNQGIAKEQMQADIDRFRKQGLSDEEIQKSLDARLENISQEIPYIGKIEKNVYSNEGVKKHPIIHKVADILPIIGAIGGGVLGEIPGAGLGALAGTMAKQDIERLSGIRQPLSKEILMPEYKEQVTSALAGMVGEGAGRLAGKGFEIIQPKIAEVFAGIPKEDYLKVLERLKQGEKIFQKGQLEKAGEKIGNIAKNADENVSILYNPLIEKLHNVINKYEGGGVNPAEMGATNKIKELLDMLKQSKMSKATPEAKEIVEALIKKDIPEEQIANEFSTINVPKDIPFEGVHKIKQHLGESNKIDWQNRTGSTNALLQDLYNTLNNSLREAHPQYEAANKEYQNLLAEKAFEQNMPHYLTHWLGRNAARAGAGTAATAIGVGALSHNPLVIPAEMSAMAQMSPKFQKILLQLYGLTRKSSIGGGVGAFVNQELSPIQKQYKKIQRENLDGSIPAEQYRNERIK